MHSRETQQSLEREAMRLGKESRDEVFPQLWRKLFEMAPIGSIDSDQAKGFANILLDNFDIRNK